MCAHGFHRTVERYLDIKLFTYTVMATTLSSITLAWTRRQEKQIVVQEISAEARQNFLKEKKTLKIPICVVVASLLCYLPIFVVRTVFQHCFSVTSAITSKNIAYICL